MRDTLRAEAVERVTVRALSAADVEAAVGVLESAHRHAGSWSPRFAPEHFQN